MSLVNDKVTGSDRWENRFNQLLNKRGQLRREDGLRDSLEFNIVPSISVKKICL